MASATPGNCTFTATWRPPAMRGAVDLTDAGGGDRDVVPGLEELDRVGTEVVLTTWAASVGAIEAAFDCSADSACWASSGSASTMKLMSWPTFISTPFISPSSAATSSAVRTANCRSSSARRSAGETKTLGLGDAVAAGVAGGQSSTAADSATRTGA